jgi:2-polyprenyl-3-methyl-5-hydroxy-6-metoxy-1,4-benzoquinol methylase
VTQATTAPLDTARKDAFLNRTVEMINHASLALMVSIGHRTGLFDTMATLPASTSAQIAAAAQLNERYVREWLGAMVVGKIVEYNPADKTYVLPPEHAASLTRAASPGNMALSMQWVAVMGYVEDHVVDAFKHGRGVPYEKYNRFHEVMAEESSQTVVAALKDHILPMVPGLIDRLTTGIDALDIACGSGRTVMEMAGLFPHSLFCGRDIATPAIDAANVEAKRRGLKNVRFEAVDVSEPDGEKVFDLVTAFDAIHDQAKPDRVLANIRRWLRPGGVFLMQDIWASSHLHKNLEHPLSPMLYTISTMHCMSVSLASGGPGLGACWGKEKALEMLAAAGFPDATVQELPHDPINLYYVAKV